MEDNRFIKNHYIYSTGVDKDGNTPFNLYERHGDAWEISHGVRLSPENNTALGKELNQGYDELKKSQHRNAVAVNRAMKKKYG